MNTVYNRPLNDQENGTGYRYIQLSSALPRALILPALLGFSATQAIVIPPISESLKRRRKVPLGLDISMS